MKRFFAVFVLSVFCFPLFLVQALDDDAAGKLESAGEKVKDLMEKYEKASTTKYNEITVTAKDTDGNPRDCTVRIYYNDYKQEKFGTSGGSFTGMFDHGKTVPGKILSVAVDDCPCRLIKMDQLGPIYPQIYEEIEKMKIVLEGEVGETITEKLTDEAKELAEKGLAKFFEGLGYGGSAMAKRFLGAVSIGADMGAPIKDFINQKINEIFDAMREEARKSHELTGDDTPVRNHVNIIKPRWQIRNLIGFTKPKPFTKYKIDLLLQCPAGAREPSRIVWKPAKGIRPITPPIINPLPVAESGGSSEQTYEEMVAETKRYNARMEAARKAREEAEARRAEERAAEEVKRKIEEEVKRKAEAAAQAKAERIAKECIKCETIKKALDAKRAEHDSAWETLGNETDTLTDLNRQTQSLKNSLSKAEGKLGNFNEPGTDYVEMDGRRIDATDIELRNAAAALGWERYMAGDVSAQDLSDYWKGLDGDAVDTLRSKVQTDLEAAVKAAKEAKANHEKAVKDQEAKKQEAIDDLNKKSKELQQLENAYKDCLKKCQNDAKIDLAKDYGMVVTQVDPLGNLWLPWNWGKQRGVSIELDESILFEVEDYSLISYEDLVEGRIEPGEVVQGNLEENNEGKNNTNPLYEETETNGENPLYEEEGAQDDEDDLATKEKKDEVKKDSRHKTNYTVSNGVLVDTNVQDGMEYDVEPIEEENLDSEEREPVAQCEAGYYNNSICGSSCGAGERCASAPGKENCYFCKDICEPNFGSRQGCNSLCEGVSGVGRCVPVGEGNNCWECLRVDPVLTSPCIGMDKFSTNRCDGTCRDSESCHRANTDEECYECKKDPVEIVEESPSCPHGSFEQSGCSVCDAGCEPVPNVENLPCYQCKDAEPPACVPDCIGKSCGGDGCGGSCGSCPNGAICSLGQCSGADEPVNCGENMYLSGEECASCPAGCTSTPGTTSVNSCVCPAPEPECPNGMFVDPGTCESSNSQGCEIGGSSEDFQCWRPKASCEDLCSQNSFSSTQIDFSVHIEGKLNAVSCVSGYSMQIQQGRVGECECYDTQPPEIQIDNTVPICAGSPCGDVVCGNSASCATGENQTTTVTCNWGGWQKEALHKYKPILGIVE